MIPWQRLRRPSWPEGANYVYEGTAEDEQLEPDGDETYIIAFGDASGGKHASDRLHRRVGVGVGFFTLAAARAQGAPRARIWGNVAGNQQEVGRGELIALRDAIRAVAPDCDLVFFTDRLSVVTGWEQRKWEAQEDGDANPDIWRDIGGRLRASPQRRVQVHKVESHMGDADVALGIGTESMRHGNDVADEAARRGADAVGVCAGTVAHNAR